MNRSSLRQVFVPLGLCLALTVVTAAGMGSITLGAGGASATNPAFLPIGDGNVTTSGPQREYVYICHASVAPPGGAGAFREGPWIRSDGTYDLTAKAIVNGAVRWSGASFHTRLTATRRIIGGNGLPTRQTTGEFPIQSGDDAYQYDRNPNSIRSQSVAYSLPRHPK
jgi:hypothetical protein